MYPPAHPRPGRCLLPLLAVFLAVGACGEEEPASPSEKTSSTNTSSIVGSTTTSTMATTTSAFVDPPGGLVSTTIRPPTGDVPITNDDVAETSNARIDFEQSTINGVDYPSALTIRTAYSSSESTQVQLDAGRRQERLLGELGVPDDQPSSTVYQVDISLDGAAPILSTEVRFGETTPLNLDVSNVLRIELTATSLSECCNSFAIGSPRFGLDG